MKRTCPKCNVDMKVMRSQTANARKKIRCPVCGLQKGLSQRPGRPPMPDHLIKKNRTLRLNDEAWDRLSEIGNGVHAAGIENLIKFYEENKPQ